ncbi:hypothetical protein IA69_29760 [Massilia sp. JS1662]|nr:hypothetical protein [Massilia sp. JS1662]KGF78530.1 hypothetical protein IA69_29760 [Massilia sp. JS1662]
MNGMSLWWWALPVVLLPILWHRQKREQTKTSLLASARFLPAAEPKLRRVWRWHDVILLVLRCLLLLTLIALLADLVLAWRGDAVLVVPGTPPAVVEKEAGQRIMLPDRDAVTWLHAHEREFEPGARLVVVGDAVMPAVLPRFRHAVELRTVAAPAAPVEHHVAVFSDRAEDWRRLFAAAEGAWHIVVDAAPGPRTELVVWDRPDAPPAGLRAPLWRAGPPHDADGARALFAAWQRQYFGVQPYTAPAQALAPDAAAPAGPASGALRHWLGLALVVLFALERIVTHVRRR